MLEIVQLAPAQRLRPYIPASWPAYRCYWNKGHWGFRIPLLSFGYACYTLFTLKRLGVSVHANFIVGWRGALDLGWIAFFPVNWK